MKLYTEEQVKKAIAIGIQVGYSEEFNIDNFDMEVDDAVFFIPSIELPSDEEIKEHFSWGYGGDSGSAIYGAKWMKDKILNQNK